jgi:hypothetical protein
LGGVSKAVSQAIVTYAAGAHEELLDIALPKYQAFADRHGYDLIVGKKMTDLPPAWNKVPLLIDALKCYDRAVWFDCDMVVTNLEDDLPPMVSDSTKGVFISSPFSHALVRHFEGDSEVPNSGVWQVRKAAVPLLLKMLELEVFTNHGWWEQAALITLMGYTVPPEGSEYEKTKCRPVHSTKWLRECHFMRLAWNSHPNYRADNPRIVHCSYKRMPQRIEVMRALVRDPHFDYPRYDGIEELDKHEGDEL